MASQTILPSIPQGELIFSWANFIIKVEIYGISSHFVLISGRGNLSLGLTLVLWKQNLRKAPYILLYATRLAERGHIVLHNNTLPLTLTWACEQNSYQSAMWIQYRKFLLQHTEPYPTQHQWVIAQSFAASDCLIILHNLIQ